MRISALLMIVTLPWSSSLGCGGIVDSGDRADAMTVLDTGGTPATGAGCPTTLPTPGQPCTSILGIPGEHFYCHYFAADSRCPRADKCTDGGDRVTKFGGSSVTPTEPCKFTVDDCDEGKPCGPVFETSGRCLVACRRSCACEPSKGTLHCAPLTCP